VDQHARDAGQLVRLPRRDGAQPAVGLDEAAVALSWRDGVAEAFPLLLARCTSPGNDTATRSVLILSSISSYK
jgi:hypothetical protein